MMSHLAVVTLSLLVAAARSFTIPHPHKHYQKCAGGHGGMMMTFENAIGALPPLGFWDPLGLLRSADEERFDRLRYVETKHGRIAMLAVVGHMVTSAGVRLPGYIADGVRFSSIKSGLRALESIPPLSLLQLTLLIGLVEVGFGSRQDEIEDECVDRMEALGWTVETQVVKASIELNNGRAAQMGILGLMVHEKLDGNPYVLNSLLGAPVPFN